MYLIKQMPFQTMPSFEDNSNNNQFQSLDLRSSDFIGDDLAELAFKELGETEEVVVFKKYLIK